MAFDEHVTQLAALLCPDDPHVTPSQLAARLRGVAARLESGAQPSARDVCEHPQPGGNDARGDVPVECEPRAHHGAAGPGDAASRGGETARLGFDISRYPHRLVALEVFYAGWPYHGFATQG